MLENSSMVGGCHGYPLHHQTDGVFLQFRKQLQSNQTKGVVDRLGGEGEGKGEGEGEGGEEVGG